MSLYFEISISCIDKNLIPMKYEDLLPLHNEKLYMYMWYLKSVFKMTQKSENF